MKWMIQTVIMMIMLLAICPVYAADDSLAELELQLEKLEQDLAQARDLAELSKELREDSVSKMFEEFKRQYEQEIKAIRTEQGQFINTTQEAQNTFKNGIAQQTLVIMVVWIVLGTVGIGTAISVVFTLRISVPKWIKAAVAERIAELTDSQQKHIRQLIDEKIQQNRLKQDKRLLLLSAQKQHKRDVEEFFETMGFNIKSLYFSEAFSQERQDMERGFRENKYDLIIFNQLDVAEIDAYMENSSHRIFMAYAPYTGRLNVKSQEKMNFANSPFTVYSRIMETLQYQEFMKAKNGQ